MGTAIRPKPPCAPPFGRAMELLKHSAMTNLSAVVERLYDQLSQISDECIAEIEGFLTDNNLTSFPIANNGIVLLAEDKDGYQDVYFRSITTLHDERLRELPTSTIVDIAYEIAHYKGDNI